MLFTARYSNIINVITMDEREQSRKELIPKTNKRRRLKVLILQGDTEKSTILLLQF